MNILTCGVSRTASYRPVIGSTPWCTPWRNPRVLHGVLPGVPPRVLHGVLPSVPPGVPLEVLTTLKTVTLYCVLVVCASCECGYEGVPIGGVPVVVYSV